MIAALGLCAVTLFWDEGFDLRSRCQLLPLTDLRFEVIGRTRDSPKETLPVTSELALETLEKVLQHAGQYRLRWHAGTIALEPRPDLLKLVEASDKAVGGSEERA